MTFDGKIWKFLGKVLDMIMVSAFWILCSLPVITIVPSTIALYYAVAKNIRHEQGYLYREFFSSFKSNLRQGIPLNLIYLLIAGFLYFIRSFYSDAVGITSNVGKIYFVFYLVVILVMVFITFYLIPVLSRFTLSLSSAFRLSIYLGIKNLGTMVPLLITLIAVAALLYVQWMTLIFLPGFYTYLMTKPVEKALRSYILTLPDADEHKDKWYMEEV